MIEKECKNLRLFEFYFYFRKIVMQDNLVGDWVGKCDVVELADSSFLMPGDDPHCMANCCSRGMKGKRSQIHCEENPVSSVIASIRLEEMARGGWFVDDCVRQAKFGEFVDGKSQFRSLGEHSRDARAGGVRRTFDSTINQEANESTGGTTFERPRSAYRLLQLRSWPR